MGNQRLVELTASITAQELAEFLKRTIEPVEGEDKNFRCHFCKSDKWHIKPYPGSEDKPMLVANPIPLTKNFAAWYFTVSCSTCGYSMFFDAQLVSRNIEKLRSEKKDSESEDKND
ncbi:TPA: hypothetical protein ACRRX3_002797 [Morganella morganii]|uniref:hypothetical protein n=1 Tax=Morganella morganii TaxID=582 RepID=UPI000D1FDA53|nr:hypothetical protein [Morganella morganii]QXO67961.1 hypothetical protein JC792_13085 [Morganella morganii]